MRRILVLAATAALAATSAGAITVANPATLNGSLVIQALAPGSDLTNNGPFKSQNTAYLLDEGLNAYANGDHTFLLHFDRQGGVLSAGRVRGSFDFLLNPGELFTGVFADVFGLRQTDNLDLANYQRSLIPGGGLLVTLVRGLEAPNVPLFGDILLISPDQNFDDGAPLYHVSYDFRNDGATLDEVRFSFSSGAVPEPATWGLMIAGFGLAGAALRRRRAVPA